MSKVKIGFAPLHRDFFDESWAMEIRKRTLRALSEIEGIEVIVPNEDLTKGGLVRNDDDAEKVIRLFKDEDIAGVLLGTMTFGDEVAALKIAEAFRGMPIMLFGTKEPPFTPDGNRRSDSFCGTLSISSGLHRRNIPFTFVGIISPEESAFLRAVEDFARTCSILKGFLGARIGLVGPRPERFETCVFNEVAMINHFGQEVIYVSLGQLFEVMDSIKDDDAQLKAIINEMRAQADTSEVSDKAVLNMARLELALRRIIKEKKLQALALRCWLEIEEVYGISPCYVLGRLTDSGIMVACESDVYGALTMLIQYLASLRSTPPHFIDWTIQHQEKEDVFLAWHCGNAPPSLVRKEAKVKLRPHSILSRVLGPERTQGTGEFQLRPGPVTICRLIEHEGKFKILITKGEIMESHQSLRGSWSWVKVEDLDKLYRTLVEEGFTHHASMIHGDYVKPIADACKFLGIETVIV